MYIFASERGKLAPLHSSLFHNTRTPPKSRLPDRWLVQAERILGNYEILSNVVTFAMRVQL